MQLRGVYVGMFTQIKTLILGIHILWNWVVLDQVHLPEQLQAFRLKRGTKLLPMLPTQQVPVTVMLLIFWTLSLEPSAHSTTFTNSVISQTQIDLTFDAASTITNADGYIILQKTGSAPTGTPIDGNTYLVGDAIGDGTVAAIVTSSSATSANITGLTAVTDYFFTLMRCNANGANSETYNYKTDESVPH